MPKSQYRVGVIGGGAIAQECHLPGYKKDRRAKIVAVADPSEERHTEIRSRFGRSVAMHKTYQAMLKNEDLDVVSVCTPNALHAKHAIAAFEAGCHVLCEKPIATTLAEADGIIGAAKAKRKKLMIGFSHRLYRGPMRCKQLIQEGVIGKPYMIRVRFAHGGPYPGWAKNSWFYNPKLSKGGALLDMGIHAIDLCHWLVGPVRKVSATVATLIKDIPVDDNALLQLEFKNKALGYIEVGWTSPPGFSGFEVYGRKGSLICDYVNGVKLCTGRKSAGRDSDMRWRVVDKKPATGGWDTEIRHWLDVVDGSARNDMGGAAGRAALAVALASYKSSRSGRKVTLR